MLTRKAVWSLIDPQNPTNWHPILLAYAKAVGVMQARPANDPRSWVFQAARHDAPPGVVPGDAHQQCQHRSWFFLPWHRLYLYYFEKIVRAIVTSPQIGGPADFALPYWNYESGSPADTLPLPFRQPTLPNSNERNPLFVDGPDRLPPLNAGWAMPSQTASSQKAMSTPQFAATGAVRGFGGGTPGRHHLDLGTTSGELERTPHNDVHSQSGGFMGNPRTAALDPIFWLHHANIDRVWNRWLAAPGSGGNPTDRAWLNETFQFHDEQPQLVTKAVSDALDTANQLDYRYDDDPAGGLAMPPPSGEAEAPTPPLEEALQLVGAAEEPVRLEGTRATVEVTVPSQTLAVAEAAGAGERPLVLSLDNIAAGRNPALVYAIYLDPRGGEGIDDRFYVGNLSLFGIESWSDLDRDEHGEGGFRLTYDVSDVVAAMSAEGAWDPGAVKVVFEPLRLVPPPDIEPEAELAAELEAVTAEEEVPIDIGRVSLFVG